MSVIMSFISEELKINFIYQSTPISLKIERNSMSKLYKPGTDNTISIPIDKKLSEDDIKILSGIIDTCANRFGE